MITAARSEILSIDRKKADIITTLRYLRRLSLDEFGELLLELPNDTLPHLSTILPRKTADEVQIKWTGSAGLTLLRQSVSFVNLLIANYCEFTGKSLKDAKVLDFGCGWGRLMRLMLYFTDPANLFGCDAWEASLQHAREASIGATLARSDTSPSSLPFDKVQFDLIYAFSVFTHLREDIVHKALHALRQAIKPDGILIITIRPVDYWSFMTNLGKADYAQFRELHMKNGFAFVPPNAGDKDANYGGASMTIEYLESHFPDWKVVRSGCTLVDPYQQFVCLRPI